jgi:hypothetical protein
MRYAVVLLWNIYVGIVYWSNLRCPTGRGMRRKTIIIDNLIWISILIMKSMYKKIYVNLYSSPHSVVTCKGTQSSWRLYVTNHRASNPDDTPLARTHHHNHPTNSTIVTHAPDVVITCSLMRELPRAIPLRRQVPRDYLSKSRKYLARVWCDANARAHNFGKTYECRTLPLAPMTCTRWLILRFWNILLSGI